MDYKELTKGLKGRQLKVSILELGKFQHEVENGIFTIETVFLFDSFSIQLNWRNSEQWFKLIEISKNGSIKITNR